MKKDLIVLIASIYAHHCLGSSGSSSGRSSIPKLDEKGWLGPNWYGWCSEENILLEADAEELKKLVKTSSETDRGSNGGNISLKEDAAEHVNKKRRRNGQALLTSSQFTK